MSAERTDQLGINANSIALGAAPAERSSLAFGLERIGLISLRFPYIVTIVRASCSASPPAFGDRAHQGRQLAEPVVPLEQRRVPAIRGGRAAIPVERIRRARRGRGQDAARRANSIEKLRESGDRPAIDRRHARPDFAVLGAPAAGRRPAAGAAVSRRICRTAPNTSKLVQRVLANEIIRGKLLSEDGTLALIVLSLDPAIVDGKGLNKTVQEIRKTIERGTRRTRRWSGSFPAFR